MDYDPAIDAFVSNTPFEGYELGLNEDEPVIKNVEEIDLGFKKEYLLTIDPAPLLWSEND